MFISMTARVSTNTNFLARTLRFSGLSNPLDVLLTNARRLRIPYN